MMIMMIRCGVVAVVAYDVDVCVVDGVCVVYGH